MRVLLADDHRMMRDGLRAVLEKAGFEVVGEAAGGREAIAEAKRLRPDVLIVDVAMPELNGVEVTRRLRAEAPEIEIIALSMHSDQRYVLAMRQAGAIGYVLKDAASSELLAALDAIARHQKPITLLDSARVPRSETPGAERRLTAREREVLQLIAEGQSSKEIAATLGIALPTVETHRRQLANKLDIHTIAELTKYAIREGLTSKDS